MIEDLFVSGMLASALIATAYVVSLEQGRLYAVGSSLFGLITANEAGRVWSGDLGIIFFGSVLALVAGLLLRLVVRKHAIALALLAAFIPPFINSVEGQIGAQGAGVPQTAFPFPAAGMAGLLGLSLVVLVARDRSGLAGAIRQAPEGNRHRRDEALASSIVESNSAGLNGNGFKRERSVLSVPSGQPSGTTTPPAAAASEEQRPASPAGRVRRVQTRYWMALALGASSIAVIALLALISVMSAGGSLVNNTLSGLFLIAATLAIASAWSAIRDRDRLVEAVHRQTDLNRRLSDTSRSGVFAVDKHLCVTMWNPALARVTGRSESSMLGKQLTEDCPLVSEPASRNCLSWAVGGLEMTCLRIPSQALLGGGSFDAYFTPIFGSGGQPKGAIGIIHINPADTQAEGHKEKHRRHGFQGAFGHGDS